MALLSAERGQRDAERHVVIIACVSVGSLFLLCACGGGGLYLLSQNNLKLTQQLNEVLQESVQEHKEEIAFLRDWRYHEQDI